MAKKSTDNTVSPRQIWAVAVLLMLITIAVACWRLLPSLGPDTEFPEQTGIDWEGYSDEPVSIYPSRPDDPSKVTGGEEATMGDGTAATPAKLFPFDPNTASLEDLIQLGLKPKVARTIINYRNKGGAFHEPEDLSKIYTLSDEDFQRLFPFIRILKKSSTRSVAKDRHGQTPPVAGSKMDRYPAKSDRPVTINTATTEDLMSLRGIGPGYANRIIKYRDILGGYHKVEQLKEVYGMTDSLYEAIRPLVIIDGENIIDLDVNNADEATLYKHPYIRKMAKHIIAYRNEIGGFKQIEDFKQVPLINDEIYRKIVPYLNIRN